MHWPPMPRSYAAIFFEGGEEGEESHRLPIEEHRHRDKFLCENHITKRMGQIVGAGYHSVIYFCMLVSLIVSCGGSLQ